MSYRFWSRTTGGFLLLMLVPLLMRPQTAAGDPGSRRQVVIAVTHQLRGSLGGGGSSGLAHIAPLIQSLRKASPDLIFVDAGGALGARIDSSQSAERAVLPMVEAME